MRIEPQPYYRPPRYPTRTHVEAHPELLRLVPKRWRGNPTVLAALGATCVLLSGCGQRQQRGRPVVAGSVHRPSRPTATWARVAPVFRHGDGRASFGCVAISPPAYLTEDEARWVIAEEAASAGLHFQANRGGDPNAALRMDGFDSGHRVYYKYIPIHRASLYGAATQFGTAGSADSEAAARNAREQIAGAHRVGAYGVFYEPIVHRRSANWQELAKHSESAKRELRADLKAQVRDFIKWLKAQGVI